MTSEFSRAVVGVCFCVSVSGCDRGQLQVLFLKSHLVFEDRVCHWDSGFTLGLLLSARQACPKCTLLRPAALLTAEGGRGSW